MFMTSNKNNMGKNTDINLFDDFENMENKKQDDMFGDFDGFCTDNKNNQKNFKKG